MSSPPGSAPHGEPGPIHTVLCTSVGLHGSLVAQELLRCAEIEIVGIVHSSRILRPGYGFLRGAWEQVRSSGIAYSLYLWGSTSLSGFLCARSAAASAARRIARGRIPVLKTRNVNDRGGIDFVSRLQPQLLVSAYFNQKLSPALLQIPRIAAVNIHPSLLPDFKGVDPVFFARLSDAPRLGVTIHHMVPELDAGNILMQAEVPIAPSVSVFGATAMLFAAGAAMLTARVGEIAAGARGTVQPAGGRYDSWPTPAQVRQLRNSGWSLMRMADLTGIPAMPSRSPDRQP